MHIDCSVIKSICDSSTGTHISMVRLIGSMLRCNNLNIMSTLDLSMLFQFNSNTADEIIKGVEGKDPSIIETIAHNLDDSRYSQWESNISNSPEEPTYWIYNTKKELEGDIPSGYERLVLPFLRLLAYDISIYNLADIFCLNVDIAKKWKLTGIAELRKYFGIN